VVWECGETSEREGEREREGGRGDQGSEINVLCSRECVRF
jgi:hypothetical protein